VAPAAAEFDIGAGVLELGSEKSALRKAFARLVLRSARRSWGSIDFTPEREKGEAPLLLKSTPGPGLLGSAKKKAR
jgi:hypothetical protein